MKTQMNSSGFMPRNVAMALLTSNHPKTNPFRKRCLIATERVCPPESRSTDAPLVPATYGQRLLRKLRKLNAKQLCTWARRVLLAGERLQDTRDNVLFTNAPEEVETAIEILSQQIEQTNMLGQAIQTELTRRASSGKGYQKPVKFKKL